MTNIIMNDIIPWAELRGITGEKLNDKAKAIVKNRVYSTAADGIKYLCRKDNVKIDIGHSPSNGRIDLRNFDDKNDTYVEYFEIINNAINMYMNDMRECHGK